MCKKNSSQRLKVNTMIDLEETRLKLQLQENNLNRTNLALEMLINFRPNASLRQINNCRKINCNQSFCNCKSGKSS